MRCWGRRVDPHHRMTTTDPDPSNQRPAPWAIALAFALVYVCWGTTYLALKIGVKVEGWPPALFGGVRVCIAGLLILGWQAFRGQSIAVPARDRLTLVICALLLFVGGNGLINAASGMLDSGVNAVLAATTPLWIALFEFMWPGGDRLSLQGWLGLLVGLAGGVLLCVPELQKADGFALNAGVWCVLGSANFWALGSLVGRYHRVSCSHLTAAAYQTIIGGASLALVGLALGEAHELPSQITAQAVASFFWLLIFGSLMGFIAYN